MPGRSMVDAACEALASRAGWRAGRFLIAGSCLAASLPAGAVPPFKHVVIVVQENRTPDNIFGSNPAFEPGVDIKGAGDSVRNSRGDLVQLGPEPMDACYDLYHTHKAFELQYTEGADKVKVIHNKKCNPPSNAQFKFVDNSTGVVDPYLTIARNWGFANRMFQTNQGPSYAAHQFLFGGTSAPSADTPLFVAENPGGGNGFDRDTGCTAPLNTRLAVIDQNGSEKSHPPVYPCYERPVLSDLLEKAGLTWRYYAPDPTGHWNAPNSINHICGTRQQGRNVVCSGADYTAHVVGDNPSQVLADIENCQLASVSWINPTAVESDHAHVTGTLGPQWVASIVNAIGSKVCGGESYWQDTVILITWDDWGGWYDHVQPFQITSPGEWGGGYTYGFRVPFLVVSAYTPAGYVSNTDLDFGSILYAAEKNFGLGFIGPGGDVFGNYADYWARPRGDLSEFFSLTSPRPFTSVPMRPGALQAIIHQPKPTVPADDD